MGEQSPSQPSPPPQTQTQTHSPNTETPPEPTTAITSTTTTTTTVSSATIEAQPLTELATVSSPPSKIPLRPRKIRKLSPETSKAEERNNPSPSQSSNKPIKGKPLQSRALALPRVTARALSCEGEVDVAIRHLQSVDPLLSALIQVHPSPTFETFHTPFLALIRSILYQQLAFKAGTSIYTRFVSLCGGENGVLPETVLGLTPQQLRQIGVSGRKASYLHDLARKYENGILSDASIVNMDDKSLFTMLTMVNGIGSWSVHMFMIFSLHRPDVLPINDLGIRKGVQMLYNLEELPRPSQMDQLCEKWRPYRSVAAWYLWRFVESKGTPSSAAAVAAGVGLPPPQLEQQQTQHQQQQQQQEQQSQLLDPLNSMFSMGACTWGQT